MAKKKVKEQKKVKAQKSNKTRNKLVPILIGVVLFVVILVVLYNQFLVKKVQNGDTVTVDYVGYLANGTIFDTTIESEGKNASLDKTQFEPLTFTIGSGQVIPGFEEEIVGMKVGKEKTFTLTPDRAYGERREDLLREFLLDTNITRYSVLSVENYTSFFDKEPKAGDNVFVPTIPWNMVVTDVSDEEVNIETLLKVGDAVNFPGLPWDSIVLEVTDDIILIKHYPKIGDYISSATNPKFAVISSISNETFTADANFPLAGETLTYKVTVKDVVEPSS